MDRKKQILILILESKNFISADAIAKQLNISSKTVRNDLEKLEGFCPEYDCEIIKKPGKGLTIKGTHEDIQRLLISLNRERETENLPWVRQQQILYLLLSAKEATLIKEISVSLYVSRATINNDLNIINDWLSKYQVDIHYVKNQGVFVKGQETSIREAFKRAIFFRQNTSAADAVKYDGSKVIYSDAIKNLESYYKIDFSEYIDLVHVLKEALGFRLSSEAVVNLAITLVVMVIRIKNGFRVILDYEIAQMLKGCDEFHSIEPIVNQVEDKMAIRFPEADKYYLLLHLLSGKRLKQDALTILLGGSDTNKIEVNKVIRKFIQVVQSDIGITLDKDERLFENLIVHIRPSLNRMLAGLTLQNPLLNEIKKDYYDIFLIVEKSAKVLEECFQLKLPEDEIAFLTLHFAVAIERKSKTIRILVACSSGVGISQLLVAKLERLFKNIEIVDVISIYDIDKYKDKGIELLISTIDIEEIEGIKTIIVNPLMTEADIKNLTEIINRNQVRTDLSHLFRGEYIFTNVQVNNKEEVLLYAYNQLFELGFVSRDFYKGLFKREIIGPTYIGCKVAVIHGEMSHVKRSCLEIISLEKAVLWNDTDYVDFIINVVCTRQDSIIFTKVFKTLGNYLDDEDFWNKLREVKDPFLLANILNKELANDY